MHKVPTPILEIAASYGTGYAVVNKKANEQPSKSVNRTKLRRR